MAKVSYFRASLVCLTGGLLVGYQFLLQGMPSIMVQPLQDAFHINLTQVGILSSAMLYLYVFLQGRAGKLAQRYGERRCLITALIAMSILCVLFACAQNYFSALVLRILMGVCSAPGVVCSMMLISRWFPGRLFALVAGVWEAINMCLAASGPAVMGQLVPEYGWRSTMLVIAGLGIIILLLTLAFVKDHPETESENFHASEAKQDKSQQPNFKENYLRDLLKTPSFVFSCIFCFGLFAVINVFASLWAVPFIKSMYPEHQVWAVQSVSFIFIGSAIGAPLTGAFASYLNRCRIVMFWCVLFSLICMTFLLYVHMSIGMISIVMMLFGISCSAYMLPFSLIRKELPLPLLYTANAVLNGCSIVAAPLLQPLVGELLTVHAHNAFMLKVADFRFALLPVYLILWVALLSLIWIKEKSSVVVPSMVTSS